jgi:hypothetical protein
MFWKEGIEGNSRGKGPGQEGTGRELMASVRKLPAYDRGVACVVGRVELQRTFSA